MFIIKFIYFLQDLIEFDKAFYDRNETEPKLLNRFRPEELFELTNQDDQESILLNKKQIIIETPTNCSYLQENIT